MNRVLELVVFWVALALLVSVAWYWITTTPWPDAWLSEDERLDEYDSHACEYVTRRGGGA